MELDDFFGNKQQDRNNYRDHRYQNSLGYSRNFSRPYQKHDTNFRWIYFLESLKNNKKLRALVISAIIMVLIITIGLIVVLLPLILKFFNYVSQNGVQGFVDYVIESLDKIWKGSSK